MPGALLPRRPLRATGVRSVRPARLGSPIIAEALRDSLAAVYPVLVAHHDRIAAVPGIAAYLDSPGRLPTINGVALG